MSKVLGYIIALVGLAGLSAATIAEAQNFFRKILPFLAGVNDTILMIISIVVIVVGIFLVTRSSEGSYDRGRELPIYRGKHVVGYRRNRI